MPLAVGRRRVEIVHTMGNGIIYRFVDRVLVDFIVGLVAAYKSLCRQAHTAVSEYRHTVAGGAVQPLGHSALSTTRFGTVGRCHAGSTGSEHAGCTEYAQITQESTPAGIELLHDLRCTLYPSTYMAALSDDMWPAVPTGQWYSHEPQPMHTLSSTLGRILPFVPFTICMAPAGQCRAQLPQCCP